jgi:hypothetical protein
MTSSTTSAQDLQKSSLKTKISFSLTIKQLTTLFLKGFLQKRLKRKDSRKRRKTDYGRKEMLKILMTQI